jgi:catechol 2,3-dioxygenase-like lactoylglutathione lyase family enzyme
MRVTGLDHAALTVRDLDVTVACYERVLATTFPLDEPPAGIQYE